MPPGLLRVMQPRTTRKNNHPGGMSDRCQSVPVPLRFAQVALSLALIAGPIWDGYGTECTKIVTGEKMEELYNQLAALARRFGAKRLVLFGSRARGDNRPNSDVDLAVYGMPEDNRAEFWMCCEELPTLLKFDIVHIQDSMEPVFLANIERDGVELMDKLHEKYDRFTAAVARLREALDDYKKYPLGLCAGWNYSTL